MSGYDTTDHVFKALASSTRRALLDLMKDHPRTTGDLCAAFPELDRCTVMQHLGILEEADLVIVQRQGRERWNYLNPLPIKHIHDRWIGAYAAQAVNLLDRLATDLGSEHETAVASSGELQPKHPPKHPRQSSTSPLDVARRRRGTRA